MREVQDKGAGGEGRSSVERSAQENGLAVSAVQSSVKPKRCRICRTEFVPRLTTQACCKPSCAIEYARLGGEKRQSAAMKRCAEAQKREDRQETRERKLKSMSLSKLKNLAQREFNRWVRERDYDQPCISCGEFVDDPVNGWDAGHFRTVGAAGHLRYNPDNCHKQCKSCNSTARRNSSGRVLAVLDVERAMTVRAKYRVRLVEKIGAARVELLEDDNRVIKWSREDLTLLRKAYFTKWRELKAAREGV